MLKIFRSRKKAIPVHPLQEKAAGWFVAKAIGVQLHWSSFMNRKVNRLSVRSKKTGLVLFIGLSVLLIISIQIETFTGKRPVSPVPAARIHSPTVLHKESVHPISPSQYQRVVAFHQYMDSLAVAGKAIYDSIMRARPGLLDSAIMVEKLYQNQNR